MSIILYTQPACPFCDIMKGMLDKTGYTYVTIDIKENTKALEFMKKKGHKTVPQLYVNDKHINKKTNTQDYTTDELYNLISESLEWKWQDSGIEGAL